MSSVRWCSLAADPGDEFERLGAVALLAFVTRAVDLGDDAVQALAIAGPTRLQVVTGRLWARGDGAEKGDVGRQSALKKEGAWRPLDKSGLWAATWY
jgi:hypothetical protein